ncbi:MAG: hypothetical protein ACPG4Z_08420, partial [Chitinophagales bacterium]
MEGFLDFFGEWGLNLAYLMIALCFLGVVAGIVISIVQDFKSGIFAIGGLLMIVVLFGIGYAMSSSDLPARLVEKGMGTPSSFRISGAGLFTFYALA